MYVVLAKKVAVIFVPLQERGNLVCFTRSGWSLGRLLADNRGSVAYIHEIK